MVETQLHASDQTTKVQTRATLIGPGLVRPPGAHWSLTLSIIGDLFKSLLLTTSLTCETLGDISSKIAKIPLQIDGMVGPQGKEQDPTKDNYSTLNLLSIKLLEDWKNPSHSRRNNLQDLYEGNSFVLFSQVKIFSHFYFRNSTISTFRHTGHRLSRQWLAIKDISVPRFSF